MARRTARRRPARSPAGRACYSGQASLSLQPGRDRELEPDWSRLCWELTESPLALV